jgi:hypothetical protein
MPPGAHAQLTALGFERLTRWVCHNDSIKLESLAWKEVAGWIYAYVSQDRVRYVGITTMVLRSRMDSYRDLANDRVRPLILSLLNEGHGLEVYGLRRAGITKADLETEERRLIHELQCDWNVRR